MMPPVFMMTPVPVMRAMPFPVIVGLIPAVAIRTIPVIGPAMAPSVEMPTAAAAVTDLHQRHAIGMHRHKRHRAGRRRHNKSCAKSAPRDDNRHYTFAKHRTSPCLPFGGAMIANERRSFPTLQNLLASKAGVITEGRGRLKSAECASIGTMAVNRVNEGHSEGLTDFAHALTQAAGYLREYDHEPPQSAPMAKRPCPASGRSRPLPALRRQPGDDVLSCRT